VPNSNGYAPASEAACNLLSLITGFPTKALARIPGHADDDAAARRRPGGRYGL